MYIVKGGIAMRYNVYFEFVIQGIEANSPEEAEELAKEYVTCSTPICEVIEVATEEEEE